MMSLCIRKWQHVSFLKLAHTRNVGQVTSASVYRRYSQVSPKESVGDDLDIKGLLDRRFEYKDVLSYSPRSLQQSLQDCLPRLRRMKPPWNSFRIPIGYQYAYFRYWFQPSHLCDDGTDHRFLPGGPQTWKYRLWAGGTVTVHRRLPPDKETNMGILLEKVSNARVLEEKGRAKKVVVSIQRQFMHLKEAMTRHPFGPYENRPEHLGQPLMTEVQKLVFFRDPPPSLKDTRVITPLSEPSFTQKTVVSQSMLFLFSAISYNAHKVHLDRGFARQNYGAKDLLVHGPLTQLLMVHFLRGYVNDTIDLKRCIEPVAITYTNLQPIYVDEPITLCCKPQSNTDSSTSQNWLVWIEKGSDEDRSMAVRASITVDILDNDLDSEQSSNYPKLTFHHGRPPPKKSAR